MLGADFTVADIEVGLPLYRYFTLETDRRARPGVAAYYERLRARPAYAENVMVDYRHLRAMYV